MPAYRFTAPPVASRLLLSLVLALVAFGAFTASPASADLESDPSSALSGRIAAGQAITCAVLDGGAVRCWGLGGNGALGYGNTTSIGDDESPAAAGPVDLGAGRTAASVSSGFAHACAVLDNGTVRCWGFGEYGRLGYGNTQDIGDDETPAAAGPVNLGGTVEPPPPPPPPVEGYLAAGGSHTCVLMDNGAVRCFGYNGSGQLGYGNTAWIGDNEAPASAGPVDLGAGRRATAISSGAGHSCAVLDDGTVRCWGDGTNGRLGYGTTDNVGDNELPAAVNPIDFGAGRDATSVAAGERHTCALLEDGTVRCWGYGEFGQLGYAGTASIGDDETAASAGPVDLGAGRTATSLAAGSHHSCAILDDGSVRCWGYNWAGQLGLGNTGTIGDDESPASAGPVDLGAGRTATAIKAGRAHTCAVLDNGDLRCWGYNEYGQLGHGNTAWIGNDESPASVAPVDLGSGRTATAISGGEEHTCAVLDDGAVRCWGRNESYGRLGLGHTNGIGDDESPASEPPVAIGAGRTATAVSAGIGHTCALLDDATVRCWGDNWAGQLGYGNSATIGDDEKPDTAGPVVVGRAVGPDVTPPESDDDVPAGWENSAVAVTLTASDTGVGVKQVNGDDAIYFTVGTSPALPTTSDSQYDASSKPHLAHGQKIRYFAVDALGNAEEPKTSSAAQVDTEKPSTPTVVVDSSQPAPVSVGGVAWYKDSVKFLVTANGDTGGSGVAPADESNVHERTRHGFKAHRFVVSDRAGNVSDPGELSVRTDATSPALSVTCQKFVVQGATKQGTFRAADSGSGLAGSDRGRVAMDTSAVGAQSISKTVSDNVGHQTTRTCDYTVTPPLRMRGSEGAALAAGTVTGLSGALKTTFTLGGQTIENTCGWTMSGRLARNEAVDGIIQRLGNTAATGCSQFAVQSAGEWSLRVAQDGQSSLPVVKGTLTGIVAWAELNGETCEFRGTVRGTWSNGDPSSFAVDGRLPVYPQSSPGSHTTSGCAVTETALSGTLSPTGGDPRTISGPA